MRTIALLLSLAASAFAGDAEFQAQTEKDCARVMAALEAWLGPKLPGPVPVSLKTKKEIGDFARALLAKEMPAELAEVAQALLERLHQVPPGYDLVERQITMVEQNVAGLYDAESNEFFVVPRERGAGKLMFMITVAHELVHAYRDVDKDYWPRMQALPRLDADWLLGVRFLVEGDAQFLGYLVGPAATTGADPAAYLEVVEKQVAGRDQMLEMALATPPLSEYPFILKEMLIAPYVDGMVFVKAIYDAGGLAALDRAYDQPPRSTEQVIHPDKYIGPEIDEPTVFTGGDPTGALGAGWRMAMTNVFGEFDLRILFVETAGRKAAEGAAAGWDGSRYWFCRRTGHPGFVGVMSTWDSAADADEFAAAWATWAATRDGLAAPVTAEGRDRRVETKEGLVVVRVAGNDVLVADGVPPDRVEPVFRSMSLATRSERAADAAPWPAPDHATSLPLGTMLLAMLALAAVAGLLFRRLC